MPRPVVRFLFWFVDSFVFGPIVSRVVEPFRAELGLPKASRFLCNWLHSSKFVLGLFPKWFAYEDDWPAKLRQTGFPLFDDASDQPLAPEVEAYLAAGEPPIVFTFGTGMKSGEKLFAASAEATKLLGRRGILLSPFREQMPKILPPTATQFGYIPLTRLLPRAAAIVHHGGIGTTSQALRAGIPQIITPLSHDQPDNADRVQRLGAGRALTVKKLSGKSLAETLKLVLENPRMAAVCKDLATRFVNKNAIAETCDILENFAKTGEASSA